MPLPKLNTPIYEFSLLSSDKKVKFRPFLVGEEKVLLMGKESDDVKSKFQIVEKILQDCCMDKSFNIDSLPYFDISYLFLQLRTKSVSEKVELQLSIPHEKIPSGDRTNIVADGTTCEPVKVIVDLEKDIVITKNKKVKDKIIIDHEKKIGIKLKYIRIKDFQNIMQNDKNENDLMKIIVNSIEYIFDDTEIYKPSEYKEDELIEWIKKIPLKNIVELKEFIEDVPSIAIKIKTKCKCGASLTTEINDFGSFF